MIDLSHLRLLLVEDNELDARTMRRHLERYEPSQFEVRWEGSLGDGLRALDEEGFDCVLLDLSLPDAVGLASVDALLDRSPKSPVVVLTGLDDPATAVEAVERGAQDYLTKHSVDPELVGRAIRYAVARHRSEIQLRVAHEELEVLLDRERIARDLHDTVIGQLFATGMSLQATSTRITDPALARKVLHAVDGIDAGIRQLREAIFALHTHEPTFGEELDQIASAKESALGFRPTIHIHSALDDVADADLRHAVVATVGEALSNVAKHARATAADIRLDLVEHDLLVEVTDNGVGIDADAAPGETSTRHGRGLLNMRDRAQAASGEFQVAPAPGGGTRLSWRVPLP